MRSGAVHSTISTLLNLYLCIRQATSQIAGDSCIWSQPNNSTLALAALYQDSVQDERFETPQRRQFIFPDTKFEGCNGIITRINFIATQYDNTHNQSPQIQLWNLIDGRTYERVRSFDIDTTRLDAVTEWRFYSYTVDPPLAFESGNVLGIFLPRRSRARLQMVFWNTGTSVSFQSNQRNSPLSTADITINNDNVPLLSVETDNQCDVGFSTMERLQLASVIRLQDEQIRLIPQLPFECDGEISNWTMAADRDNQENEYPHLQIWRPSGNGYSRTETAVLSTNIELNSENYIYSGVIDPPLQFSAGDIPGLYLPQSSDSALNMYVLNGFGPVNFVFPSLDSTATSIQSSSATMETAVPLVSLGIVFSISPTGHSSQPTPTSTVASQSGIPSGVITSNPNSAVMSTEVQSTTISLKSSVTRNIDILMPTFTIIQPTVTSESVPPLTKTDLDLLNLPSKTLAFTSSRMPDKASNLPMTGIPLTLVIISVPVSITGALVLLLMITLLLALLIRKRKRKYKLPNVNNSQTDSGFTNPIYSDTEGTVIANNGRLAGADLEQTYAELDDGQILMNGSEEERVFENSLYSDYRLITDEQQLDESLYATPHPPSKVSAAGQLYVPTKSQRAAISHDVTDSSIYEGIYSTVNEDTSLEFFEEEPLYWNPSSVESELYEQLARHKYREIPFTDLEVSDCVGSGQFGVVEKGLWNSSEGPKSVAIKSLKEEVREGEEDKVKFLQEAAINGQFHHPSIITLHGVVTVGKKPMIVLELMEGDMRNYLLQLQSRIEREECSTETVATQCLDYSRQIASGMKYLSNKQFVHRDLAARNILMSQDEQQCKISDFGMARDLEDSDYYVSHGGQIPVKWTAPEAINYKKYSTASDVWSFGALLYEIWSLGHKPFEGMTNMKVIRKVSKGFRLPPPPGCPRTLYQLMINCWHPESKSRPLFSDTVKYLSQSTSILLDWKATEKEKHEQASKLGAPLEAGYDLYSDLQKTYTQAA